MIMTRAVFFLCLLLTSSIASAAKKKGKGKDSTTTPTDPLPTDPPTDPPMNVIDPVNLGTAGDFAILSQSGVTTTGIISSVVGDMGTYFTYASFTGFNLDPAVPNATTVYSESPLVAGRVYASDYIVPTPAKLLVAVQDMGEAYSDAETRNEDPVLDLDAGLINGRTLVPGLYNWAMTVSSASVLTFRGAGSGDDVWILQIDKNLEVGDGAHVILQNGAKAANIFWQVAEVVSIGTTAHVEGVVLCKTGITFKSGSSLNGAALAQTSVTLINTTIYKDS